MGSGMMIMRQTMHSSICHAQVGAAKTCGPNPLGAAKPAARITIYRGAACGPSAALLRPPIKSAWAAAQPARRRGSACWRAFCACREVLGAAC